MLGIEECPHYTTLRQVTLPSNFTPVAVCPLKLSSALPSFSMSVVVALPVVPLLARSARWNGSSNTSVADDIALQVNMSEVLALAVGLGVRYNSDPPPLAESTDTLFTVNLVYNIK